MNTRVTLGLALILSGGLLGCCSTTASRISEVQPLNKDRAKTKLKVVSVDSEEKDAQDGYAENAIDGDPNTYWHTQWHTKSPGFPHEIVIELLPPSIIKGFSYLPRQDESDHGTIKDYEFYVSNDGRHFGKALSKGRFGQGKGEKIERFEPVKCRFIKLRAISEINGLPWASAAEIRVIQSDDEVSKKDYWQGENSRMVRSTNTQNNQAKPDKIDEFLAALSANGGLWLNGIDELGGSDALSPERVVSETLQKAKFKAGLLTGYQIASVRKVRIEELPDSDCTVVLVDTNLGQMIVLMQYFKGDDSTPGHWWRRIYDASPRITRLY